MISNILMVNDSKTGFLIVGGKQQHESVNIPFIHMGEDQITPVMSVRDLSVNLDSNLKTDIQMTKVCQHAYNHMHNIGRIIIITVSHKKNSSVCKTQLLDQFTISENMIV